MTTSAPLPQTDSPRAFDHGPRTRLVFGVNSLERVGELARELGARRILLVSDPGVVAAGHVARAEGYLREAGLTVTLFDQAEQNPTTRCVDACVAVAREAEVDFLMALGGGSSLDTAKGCNFLLTNGGRMQDYWGVGKATQPMLPFIAIPTTAGTGSECQCAALIADVETHQKMACLDPKAAARVAILDPVLTLSQPAAVTACSGIDAVAHVVETAVTRPRNGMSLLYADEAAKLTFEGLPRVLRKPDDLEARGRMLLGAAFAGLAIECSMLGAAHSAANPLTAHHGVVHGQAVGMMLPQVVRFNAADPEARRAYLRLLEGPLLSLLPRPQSSGDRVSDLATYLEHLLDLAGMPRQLSACGVKDGEIAQLAQEASRQWTAQFNPRSVTAEDFEALYRAAL